MYKELIVYPKPKDPIKFKVVGLIPSIEYQKCRFFVQKMHDCFPLEFAKPEIRAMLNLDWDEYLTKMKRRHGKPYYLLHVPVAVYKDGVLMGNHKDLIAYIAKSYILETNLNFEEIANQELINYFSNITNLYKRKFVYLTVAIDERIVGSMLFMLYNDLVPATCENFFKRCTNPLGGYRGTKIHRIARYSWIQCGGLKLKKNNMRCENYSVPHNRRGVLSMCNERRHRNNTSQFFITLEAADWMDYNYVAFGQLIQGAEILNLIEKIPTKYQNPLKKIQITQCGEFSLCPSRDVEFDKVLNPPFEELFKEGPTTDDVDSVLSETGFKQGKYFLRTDLQRYMPFKRYSKMFDGYLKSMDIKDQIESLLSHEPEAEEAEPEPEPPRGGKLLTVDTRKVIISRTFYIARKKS